MGKATIFISGTVSQLPRYREVQTKNGARTVMSFNVPADNGSGERKQTIFYECDYWVAPTDKAMNYLSHAMGKGAKVAVMGVHRTREWTGSDGEVHHVECVDVRELDVLQAAPAVDVKDEPQERTNAPQDGSQGLYDADMPF